MGRSEQFILGHAFLCIASEPGFIRCIFEQSAHEVCHAWDHFTHGHVFPNAKPAILADLLHLIDHAPEHLDLNGVHWQASVLDRNQSGSKRSQIVRAHGKFDAAFFGSSRCGIDKLLHHSLKAGIGVVLLGPDWFRPSVHICSDDFFVPIGSLDKAHRDLPSRAFGPFDDSFGICIATAKVCLHGQVSFKIESLAATFKEFERQVLVAVMLHVEVDEHTVASGLFQYRPDHVDQAFQGTFKIDWICSCV